MVLSVRLMVLVVEHCWDASGIMINAVLATHAENVVCKADRWCLCLAGPAADTLPVCIGEPSGQVP